MFQIIWFVALIAWQPMGWLLMFSKLITVSDPVPFHSSEGRDTSSGLKLAGWFLLYKAFRSSVEEATMVQNIRNNKKSMSIFLLFNTHKGRLSL